ncbi:MAG: GNAT family N-acetyltransferase [Anaerolineae bacterium]
MTGLSAILERKPPLSGASRFEPGRDLRAVISLLQDGFQDELEERDRRWLDEMGGLSAAGPLLSFVMKVFPPAAAGLAGYVWHEDGVLVANASLMRSTEDVWQVANVVTHPDHRRRGIGRRLMGAVIDDARRRGARQLQLQVRTDNEAGQTLYGDLGFRRLQATAKFRLRDASAAVRLSEPARGFAVVEWGRGEAHMVRRLLTRAGEDGAATHPGLVRVASRRSDARSMFDDWLRMNRHFRFAAVEVGSYRGVAVARSSEREPMHLLDVVADPLWRGRVEAPLINAALIQLARQAPREVQAEIDDREIGAESALRRAGFRHVRTLDRLALDL